MEAIDALTNELKEEPVVEAIADKIDDVAEAMPPKAKALLGGEGHPVHALLSDLPIGFWVGSLILDLLGGRRSRRVSAAFVGLGVSAAAPAVAAGVVEFDKLEHDDPKREAGVVHTVSSVLGTAFFLWSFLLRLRGKRFKGIFFSLLGTAAAVAGGYLGEQLTHKGQDTDAEGTKRDQMRVAV